MLRSFLAPSFVGEGLKDQCRQTGGNWGASVWRQKKEGGRGEGNKTTFISLPEGGMSCLSTAWLFPTLYCFPHILIYFLKPSCCCNTDP